MKPSILPAGLLLAPSVLAIDTSPFYPPWSDPTIDKRAAEVLDILLKRDDNCPSGYNACTALGNSGACCRDGTICSLDAASHIACCPTGASCTGSLSGSPTETGSTSSGFMFPQPTSASTTTSDSPSITGTTVTGAPYPFVYIPTTFANAQTCSSYYSQCQSQYSSCQSSLGGTNGVTVAGSGGAGITVQGATATADAQSICSSLSRKACYGLQIGYCTAFGSSGESATTTSGQFVNPNDASSIRVSSSLYDLGVAVAVGIAGTFI
ncbi:hypothetical protein DTO063F5_8716 [Paecilomyces variotii]|nr:hypothetical protein DTO063F5_8716 [Paecilomyces variotii]